MGFGDNLKEYRKLAGLTQAEVAERLGIGKRAYAAYEAEESFPKDQMKLEILAEALDANLDELIPSEKGQDDDELCLLAAELASAMKRFDTSGAARDAVIKYLQEVYWARKKRSKAAKISGFTKLIESHDTEGAHTEAGTQSGQLGFFPNYFIWGVTDNPDDFTIVWNELKNGTLRQGWGKNGMDIRRTFSEVRDQWVKEGWPVEECHWRYEKFQSMNAIKEDDIIIIKNVDIDKPYNVSCCFTLAKCTAPYTFDPVMPKNDFGHKIGVKPLISYHLGGEDNKLFKAIWRQRGAHGRAFDVLDAENDKELINAISYLL